MPGSWAGPTPTPFTPTTRRWRFSFTQRWASYGWLYPAGNFDTVHLHDYHVGLIPLSGRRLPAGEGDSFYHSQRHPSGITALADGGYSSLDRLNLPGEKLFHQYFDYFDNLNLMKARMLKAHESGGRITTVSGDLAGTWGYAAELRETHAAIVVRAEAQKGGPVGRVFHPNNHLDLFEKLPIAGITNGMSDRNRAENLPELKAEVLRALQEKRGPHAPLFANPTVPGRNAGPRSHL
ncbi:MAG: glycogen/starch synthase [Anaerolineae bacterium]